MKRLISVATGVFVFLTVFAGASVAQERLKLATTTSVDNTGLLGYLLPHFEKQCACKVNVIAVGTGQALKLASNGDVDMVIVHDPEAEKEFVDSGGGIDRKTFMENDFVILGPAGDPAGIKGMKDAAAAFSKIAKAGAAFISRGDGSGTHSKEQHLWSKAGIKPEGKWYMEAGQGMGAVITMADNKQAYTLSDRGTYLSRMKNIGLAVLAEGDPDLLNRYSAIVVNPKRIPGAKYPLSRKFIDWLCSPEGQKLIGDFKVDGHQLFTPIVSKEK